MVKLLLIPILYGGLYDDFSQGSKNSTLATTNGSSGAPKPNVIVLVTCANRISKSFTPRMVCILLLVTRK